MASNKRMFSNEIVGSDAFLDMPISTQALYFHLGMKADDDGFVSPKSIMRMVGACEDELKVLLAKRFVIQFESGIFVIKHWRINNNKIQGDRYKMTLYKNELSQIYIKDNMAYTLDSTKGKPVCLQSVNKLLTQNRIEENRIDKNRIYNNTHTSKKFVKPNIEEVKSYCSERGNKVNPQRFIDYYESNGWRVGKNPMKDWKASIRTWEQKDTTNSPKNVLRTSESQDIINKIKIHS